MGTAVDFCKADEYWQLTHPHGSGVSRLRCCHYAWLPPETVSAFLLNVLALCSQAAGRVAPGVKVQTRGLVVCWESSLALSKGVCVCVFGDSSCALIFSLDPASKPTH